MFGAPPWWSVDVGRGLLGEMRRPRGDGSGGTEGGVATGDLEDGAGDVELGTVRGDDEGGALEDLEAAVVLGGLGCGQAGDGHGPGQVGDDVGGGAVTLVTLLLDGGGERGWFRGLTKARPDRFRKTCQVALMIL